ncbi:MAG TPA: pilus assembly protein TadG-related protein, partial [Acidimicrobiia bacterium]|nr:pilus assembly protein TadG-related protein [Acidimicrobiia bacterium]
MSRREREGGFVLLWFALSIVLLLGLAAFVVDLMHGYSQAQKVQNSADAGALAGVVYMPGHDADAAALAESVVRNNVEDPAADVDVWTDTQCDPDCLPNQIQVEVRASYPTYFAKIFGSRFD